jgi:subtilisin family serine protease
MLNDFSVNLISSHSSDGVSIDSGLFRGKQRDTIVPLQPKSQIGSSEIRLEYEQTHAFSTDDVNSHRLDTSYQIISPVKLLSSPTQPSTNNTSENWDELTGLNPDESWIMKPEKTNLNAPAKRSVSKRRASVRLTSESFDPVTGYGLVNAAKAVAKTTNASPFVKVANLGKDSWGLDAVSAPEVWTKGFTGQGVTVAVIDSGVDIDHPDLRENIWINSDEIAGDGIDNDANGYIDDINGWNFGIGQNNANVLPGTNDPGQGHGTHVAGTVAAKNNELGNTGVAPNAKIMALRLGDVSGGRFVNGGSLAQAVRYAVDNGARVINMSLSSPDTPQLQSALAYAASRNVITVSAAGNDGLSAPESPARYATQYGFSVGAINRDRSVARFSNRAGVNRRLQHVLAPGVQIYSTLPGNSYGFLSGTSMATPHVAGVVALMLSADPNLTHNQVRQIMAHTAEA